MVPAPTMPTRAMFRKARSLASPGILPASRSAKNKWRIAAEAGDASTWAKTPASTASPAAKGSVTAASAQRTKPASAGYCGLPAAAAWALAKKSVETAPGATCSLLRRSATPPGAASMACTAAKPACSRPSSMRAAGAGSIKASTSPAASASAAEIIRPLCIKSSASAAPTRRGRRCVPKDPGIRPSLTSGRPRRVLASASRW